MVRLDVLCALRFLLVLSHTTFACPLRLAAAYTQQALVNDLVETGPRFVDTEPTEEEKICEATFFSVCSM